MKCLPGLALLMEGCAAKVGEATEPESVVVKASALPDARDLRAADTGQVIGERWINLRSEPGDTIY